MRFRNSRNLPVPFAVLPDEAGPLQVIDGNRGLAARQSHSFPMRLRIGRDLAQGDHLVVVLVGRVKGLGGHRQRSRQEKEDF